MTGTDRKFGLAELLLLFSVLVLVVVVAVPILLIIWNAFVVDGGLNIAGVAQVLSQPDVFQAVVNSLVIAAAVTVLSTILGVFFAWLVSRTDLPFKETMKLLFLVPFMLPSFIGAIAWKILLSPRAGLVNKGFMSLFISGLERQNPRALIEAEKENLRVQIARFNENLANHAGFCERLLREGRVLAFPGGVYGDYTDDFIRLSVGLEDVGDLIEDLAEGLAAAR